MLSESDDQIFSVSSVSLHWFVAQEFSQLYLFINFVSNVGPNDFQNAENVDGMWTESNY